MKFSQLLEQAEGDPSLAHKWLLRHVPREKPFFELDKEDLKKQYEKELKEDEEQRSNAQRQRSVSQPTVASLSTQQLQQQENHASFNMLKHLIFQSDLTLSLHILQQHSNKFRKSLAFKGKKVAFLPSPFQACILRHLKQNRCKYGLIILPTGIGKTILSLLSVEQSIPKKKKKRKFVMKNHTQSNKRQRLNENASRTAKPVANNGQISLVNMISKTSKVNTSPRANATTSAPNPRAHSPTTTSDKSKNSFKKPSGKATKQATLFETYQHLSHGISMNHKKDECENWAPFSFLFVVHTCAIRDSAFHKFSVHFTSKDVSEDRFLIVDGENLRTLNGKMVNTKREKALAERLWKRTKFAFCLFQSFDHVPKSYIERLTHVVFDEVHHLLAPSFKKVYSTICHAPQIVSVLGITATLFRCDDPNGEKLRSLFDNHVYVDFPFYIAKSLNFFPPVEYLESVPTLRNGKDIPTYETLLEKYLGPRCMTEPDVIAVKHFVNQLENSLKAIGMYDPGDVTKKLTPQTVVDILCCYLRNRTKFKLQPKRKILIFARNVQEANQITYLLNKVSDLKMEAFAAHYKIKKTDLTETFEKFSKKKRRTHVLVTVSMLTEGFDVEAIDCLVFARVTDSELVYLQQLGRGLRDPDNEVAILDLAMNLRRRWKRLSGDLPNEILGRLIHVFWRVDNFVDASKLGE
mmetsp:Transcript_9136/g.33721  ORF Transcript_9136/g.33721 Transcript_9136/m.33721 type:complete len:691 (-) Transcript_9136:94-2166(-)